MSDADDQRGHDQDGFGTQRSFERLCGALEASLHNICTAAKKLPLVKIIQRCRHFFCQSGQAALDPRRRESMLQPI
jgi:hypothetical protein